MNGSMLDVRRLRKTFGGIVACDDVSFTAEDGQIVGLVGPDGAGKTTTFRILCGIMSADAGQAVVAGHDVAANPEAVKREIGYLPQRFSLHRDLTVWENIRYVAELYGMSDDLWQPKANELLDITDMSLFRGRLAARLSGGMKQKLALLCALIHRPRLLLLDEPTTGVDPVSRRDFWRILYSLPQEGVTILISTPYMDEAWRCNRIALMYGGRVVALGTPEEIRNVSRYRYLELSCDNQRQARLALQALPQVQSVEVFGDRLHVALQPGVADSVVSEALATVLGQCAEPTEIRASLEDVFMELTRHSISSE